jgi:hypothetical protein
MNIKYQVAENVYDDDIFISIYVNVFGCGAVFNSSSKFSKILTSGKRELKQSHLIRSPCIGFEITGRKGFMFSAVMTFINTTREKSMECRDWSNQATFHQYTAKKIPTYMTDAKVYICEPILTQNFSEIFVLEKRFQVFFVYNSKMRIHKSEVI